MANLIKKNVLIFKALNAHTSWGLWVCVASGFSKIEKKADFLKIIIISINAYMTLYNYFIHCVIFEPFTSL